MRGAGQRVRAVGQASLSPAETGITRFWFGARSSGPDPRSLCPSDLREWAQRSGLAQPQACPRCLHCLSTLGRPLLEVTRRSTCASHGSDSARGAAKALCPQAQRAPGEPRAGARAVGGARPPMRGMRPPPTVGTRSEQGVQRGRQQSGGGRACWAWPDWRRQRAAGASARRRVLDGRRVEVAESPMCPRGRRRRARRSRPPALKRAQLTPPARAMAVGHVKGAGAAPRDSNP